MHWKFWASSCSGRMRVPRWLLAIQKGKKNKFLYSLFILLINTLPHWTLDTFFMYKSEGEAQRKRKGKVVDLYWIAIRLSRVLHGIGAPVLPYWRLRWLSTGHEARGGAMYYGIDIGTVVRWAFCKMGAPHCGIKIKAVVNWAWCKIGCPPLRY